jgi:hypothetical protein
VTSVAKRATLLTLCATPPQQIRIAIADSLPRFLPFELDPTYRA